jgi:lipopolysaccharide transport system ATP-binding protein
MSNVVIKVENLGKQYRLGQVGTGTLSHDLNRWWHKVRGKEDPYLKIGEANDRSVKGESDLVWALKDINFEVKRGEVLGIIGKNGAGKSTLLKILSQVTGPTVGEIKVKGRIASLLEVGTGFHPELTGRENIFLNGAILGMTKAEIRSKFDEIVAFSGVERYIDTPVKRYSSGMYVRLAFAVAAHLEPEILIVDEVLAVGDAEFQEKCLGKMKAVSGEGRTVLFVSHNLPAVRSLCKTGLYLRNGSIMNAGKVEEVLSAYLQENRIVAETGIIPENFVRSGGSGEAQFTKVSLTDFERKSLKILQFRQPIQVTIELNVFKQILDCTLCIIVANAAGDNVVFVRDKGQTLIRSKNFDEGQYVIDVSLNLTLMPGNYSLTAGLFYTKKGLTIDWIENIYAFKVLSSGYQDQEDYPYYTVHGNVESESQWTYVKQNN